MKNETHYKLCTVQTVSRLVPQVQMVTVVVHVLTIRKLHVIS